MATALQIQALVESHFKKDEQRFNQTVMQIAATASKHGPSPFSKKLISLLDQEKRKANIVNSSLHGEIAGMVETIYPEIKLKHVSLDEANKRALERLVMEHNNCEKLRALDLKPKSKLLFVGPSGTGKTMTASALAGEMGIPLYSIRLDAMISRYMGETSAKLRQIFDLMNEHRGVYFFDEFDSIGSKRELANDVGEARRILNSFLIMMEQNTSESIIVAATNFESLLDKALFRRFDDILEYTLPNEKEADSFLLAYLDQHINVNELGYTQQITSIMAGKMSYAVIKQAAQQCLKDMVLDNQKTITVNQIVDALKACVRKMPGT